MNICCSMRQQPKDNLFSAIILHISTTKKVKQFVYWLKPLQHQCKKCIPHFLSWYPVLEMKYYSNSNEFTQVRLIYFADIPENYKRKSVIKLTHTNSFMNTTHGYFIQSLYFCRCLCFPAKLKKSFTLYEHLVYLIIWIRFNTISNVHERNYIQDNILSEMHQLILIFKNNVSF